MSETEPIAGQLDVDKVLELVVRDSVATATESVRGELVAPAADLVERFAATLVAPAADSAHVRAGVRALCALARPLAGPED